MIFSMLAAAAVLIVLFSLYYTFKLGRQTSLQETDKDLPPGQESTKAHPYMLNPIFLAYIGAGVIAALLIGFFITRHYF
ncbi:hypothetical protein LRR81_14565 [Metabacillus sp. GX 13764]|uniref:hypothetical protein n=1 Tax=Metabacillus kandeliae TaxID=2900151 RepID=UPI001E32CB13|nr:hypothetical protein [Metabacillus kandeliae]MCD7035465.1 hypothetical protein [Metabacillus kandeliae]